MGHEHGDLTEHACQPPRRSIHALVLACEQAPGVARVPVAAQELASVGDAPPESCCQRILRQLRRADLPRPTVLMGPREEPLIKEAISRQARLARGQGWRQGLQVAVAAGGGAQAVLVWPCEAPLLRAQTLDALLEAGPVELVRQEPLWVRSPAVGHEDRDLGQPWLLSMRAAQAALAQAQAQTLREALLSAGVFWQRVLVEDRLVLAQMGGSAQSWPWLSKQGREEL